MVFESLLLIPTKSVVEAANVILSVLSENSCRGNGLISVPVWENS